MLHMTTRSTNDVTILDLRGAITSGSAEAALGNKVQTMVRDGHRKLLVNLARVTTTDGAGLNALLGALLAAREAGAEMKLTNLEGLRNLLVIVALHRYFEAFDCEPDAVESFRTAPRMAGMLDREQHDLSYGTMQAA